MKKKTKNTKTKKQNKTKQNKKNLSFSGTSKFFLIQAVNYSIIETLHFSLLLLQLVMGTKGLFMLVLRCVVLPYCTDRTMIATFAVVVVVVVVFVLFLLMIQYMVSSSESIVSDLES